MFNPKDLISGHQGIVIPVVKNSADAPIALAIGYANGTKITATALAEKATQFANRDISRKVLARVMGEVGAVFDQGILTWIHQWDSGGTAAGQRRDKATPGNKKVRPDQGQRRDTSGTSAGYFLDKREIYIRARSDHGPVVEKERLSTHTGLIPGMKRPLFRFEKEPLLAWMQATWPRKYRTREDAEGAVDEAEDFEEFILARLWDIPGDPWTRVAHYVSLAWPVPGVVSVQAVAEDLKNLFQDVEDLAQAVQAIQAFRVKNIEMAREPQYVTEVHNFFGGRRAWLHSFVDPIALAKSLHQARIETWEEQARRILERKRVVKQAKRRVSSKRLAEENRHQEQTSDDLITPKLEQLTRGMEKARREWPDLPAIEKVLAYLAEVRAEDDPDLEVVEAQLSTLEGELGEEFQKGLSPDLLQSCAEEVGEDDARGWARYEYGPPKVSLL